MRDGSSIYDLPGVYALMLEQMREAGILSPYAVLPEWTAAAGMSMAEWLTAVLDAVLAGRPR